MSSRIAAARRTNTSSVLSTLELRSRRVPLGRINRTSRAGDRAVKAPSLREHRPEAPPPPPEQAPLEPFHHTEFPIGDPEDVQDVTEYEHIIYRSLRQKENSENQLVFIQTEITQKDRGVLVDSICRVHYHLRLTTNTLYRCIGILDRYLSKVQVSKRRMNLVGAACLFISTKIEDVWPASAADIVKSWNREFTTRDLFNEEIKVANATGFLHTFGTSLTFLTMFLRISGQNKETMLLARYIMEICQSHEGFYGVKPSLIAALAVMVTRILKGEEKWPARMAEYTQYSEETLSTYASLVRAMLLEDDRDETRFMKKKYGSDLFRNVSHIKVPSTFV